MSKIELKFLFTNKKVKKKKKKKKKKKGHTPLETEKWEK